MLMSEAVAQHGMLIENVTVNYEDSLNVKVLVTLHNGPELQFTNPGADEIKKVHLMQLGELQVEGYPKVQVCLGE